MILIKKVNSTLNAGDCGSYKDRYIISLALETIIVVCFYELDNFRYLIHVGPCNIYPSVTGLFQLARCPPGPSIMIYMARFSSFFFEALNNFSSYVYISCFLYPSISGHACRSYVLSILNNTTTSMRGAAISLKS